MWYLKCSALHIFTAHELLAKSSCSNALTCLYMYARRNMCRICRCYRRYFIKPTILQTCFVAEYLGSIPWLIAFCSAYGVTKQSLSEHSPSKSSYEDRGKQDDEDEGSR